MITTFEFFKDQNHHEGYKRFVLSTTLWLLIKPEELKWNNKQDNTRFKLVQALIDQEIPCKVSTQEVQEWEEFKIEPAKAVFRLPFTANLLYLSTL
jgi:hypothetical protein